MKDWYTVLATADVHMSNRLSYARPTKNGLTDRFEEQIAFWKEVERACHKETVDAVLILGDLFDKSMVDAVTLTHTVEAIVNLPCEVYILPGNHDASSITGGRFTVEAFASMRKKNIHCLQRPEVGTAIHINEWLRFYPVPFSTAEVANAHIEACQQEIADHKQPGQDILLLHHSIIGCEHLGWKCDQGLDSELICEGFDAVWAGHFHRHQRFGPDLNGMYLGAPMHHDFGDVGRGAFLWRMVIRPDEIEKTKVEVPMMPRFYTARFNLADKSWSGDDPTETSLKIGDFWRDEIMATHDQWAEFKPSLLERAKELEAMGVRYSSKHRPIRSHEERLTEGDDETAVMTLEKQVKRYVDAAWTGDKKAKGTVLGYGLELLKEARNAR